MPGRDNPIPISDTEHLPTKLRNRIPSDQPQQPVAKDEEAYRRVSSTQHEEPKNNGPSSSKEGEEASAQDAEADKNDQTDMIPQLNVNGYASKKSLAQGMLDLALLASNAAQLKFILSAGSDHPFYTLLIVLIVLSICLQVLQAIICVVLCLILDINKVDEQRKASICNDTCVAIVVVIVALNVVISAFDMRVTTELRIFTSTTVVED